MKKAALISCVVAVVLLLTNPGLPAHRAAMAEYMLNATSSGQVVKSLPPSEFKQANAMMQEVAAQLVVRKSYGLFSLTQVADGSRFKTVGIGILGQVYINPV